MRASPASISAFALAVFLFGCERADDLEPTAAPVVEERMEILLPGLIDAIQAKQPVFVMDHVSTDFKDDRGLDYFGVRALVESWAFRDDQVGARLESVAITPAENGTQRVVARVSFAVGQRLVEAAPLPPGAVTYSLDLVFARDGARWQALSGSYRRE